MLTFFELDEAVKKYCRNDECFPDEYENVDDENGRLVTRLTWYPDKEDGNDSYDYITDDDWAEWACDYFKSYGKEAKIVDDGIVIFDEYEEYEDWERNNR